MVNFVKKVKKKAAGDLLPGEKILDARVVQPAGTTVRNAFAAGTRQMVRGSMTDYRIAAWYNRAERERQADVDSAGGMAVDFPTSKCFFTLTDQRVLVHSFSAMTGSPKDLLATYSLNDFAGMEGQQGKLVSKLTLAMIDGSTVALDVMKGGGDPQTLVDAFNQALPAVD